MGQSSNGLIQQANFSHNELASKCTFLELSSQSSITFEETVFSDSYLAKDAFYWKISQSYFTLTSANILNIHIEGASDPTAINSVPLALVSVQSTFTINSAQIQNCTNPFRILSSVISLSQIKIDDPRRYGPKRYLVEASDSQLSLSEIVIQNIERVGERQIFESFISNYKGLTSIDDLAIYGIPSFGGPFITQSKGNLHIDKLRISNLNLQNGDPIIYQTEADMFSLKNSNFVECSQVLTANFISKVEFSNVIIKPKLVWQQAL